MKTMPAIAAALLSAQLFAMPRAENVTFSQSGPTVSVTYTLSESPAIVTMDIQTNVTGDVWASIGGENVVPGVSAGSDVFRKVSGKETYSITWTPNRSWAGHNQSAGKTRAVVTAWSLANPPDYMAVDITEQAQPNTQRYYPSADFVPGGVLGNAAYRASVLLMRRIHARNKTFTMGSFSESGRNADREPSHTATLTNDFYIAVFETTQSQWRQLKGNLPSYFKHEGYRVLRPVDQVSYNDVRISTDNKYYAANDFPNPPYANSWLGLLRTRTGIDFDLPGEAQWEFACRAGHGEGEWGNGATYTTSDLTIARHIASAGNNTSPASMCDTTLGTATCGSCPPNDWGLYDMHGNLSEWCLDWYADGVDLDYHVNINPENPANRLDSDVAGSQKSRRGGSWVHGIQDARSAARNRDGPGTRWNAIGFRVTCPVEAK
ncbi:MAG: formylglycine-generating enzyme family protein [Kiritimatiellae bacterium]|nr:formylglycine-generating enzyme family protein [Kiritimatiellia bacterium]